MEISFSVPLWTMAEEMGYSPITTLWQDFTIAERFGISAIMDTYRKGFAFAKGCGYKEVTELVMVLNHKIWAWYERDEAVARVYNGLWEKVDEWACNHLKGAELDYFYQTTD